MSNTTVPDLERNVRAIADTLTALDTINDVIIKGGHSYPATVDDVTTWLNEAFNDEEITEDELAGALLELQFSPELLSDDGADVFDAYLHDALDITILGKKFGRMNKWHVTGASVLVAFGGPTIFVDSNLEGDYVTVRGYWASDSFKLDVYAAGIAEYMRMYADGVE